MAVDGITEIGPETEGMWNVDGKPVIRLILPKAPSANRYFRVYRGRAVKSTEARTYIATVRGIAKALRVKPIEGEVALSVHWYRGAKRGDLDNTLKVLGDALNGVAYQDDRQVAKITMERTDGETPERVEVMVWKL